MVLRLRNSQECLYDDAMRLYGNDKPDIRFGMEFGELNEVTQHKDFGVFNNAELVVGIAVPGGNAYTRKEIDKLIDWVKRPQVGALGMIYARVMKMELLNLL